MAGVLDSGFTKDEIANMFDQHGLLDKKSNADGGDSCQRQGMYYTLVKIIGDKYEYPYHEDPYALYSMKMLQPHPGIILRHTKKDWWASDWDRGSRDQTIPYLTMCALNDTRFLTKYLKGFAKRLFLFTNNTRRNWVTKSNHGQPHWNSTYDYSWKIPDIAISLWPIFIRGFGIKILWPILLILDIELVINSLIYRLKPDYSDVLNHTTLMMFSRHKMPTPWVWLANKIHPTKLAAKKMKVYFKGEGDLKFFPQMFMETEEVIVGDNR